MRSIYSARNGMIAQQRRVDTIANNLANINNDGFKRTRMDFEDCLYQTMSRVIQPQDDLDMQMGHGTIVGATTKIMDAGNLLMTESTTDLAIEGDGFYAIESTTGEIVYTRNGSFSVDGAGFLVCSDGSYVLDENYDRISVGTSRFTCGMSGEITVDGRQITRIGIFNCINPQGLEAVGTDRFAVSANSGDMVAENNFKIRQGYLEGSNVKMEEEVTLLIRAQRALSLASKALTTADEMDAQANQLRR